MGLLLWKMFPLRQVSILSRPFIAGPGILQFRTPESVVSDSLRLATVIQLMFSPLLSAWGPFSWIANLLEHRTKPHVTTPPTLAEPLDPLLKPCQVLQGKLCEICQDTMRRPVQLTCAHKFCKKCARHSLAQLVTCPVCFRQPLPWNPEEGNKATFAVIWVLRCLATFLDVFVTSIAIKHIAPRVLDWPAPNTISHLADVQILCALVIQATLAIIGPTTILGRSMGLSGMPADFVSYIDSYLVIYGLLSSWGVQFGKLGSGLDLQRALDATRGFVSGLESKLSDLVAW
ncbi:hypothetical protein Q7P37_011225 [Cladosporium fusiforme]